MNRINKLKVNALSLAMLLSATTQAASAESKLSKAHKIADKVASVDCRLDSKGAGIDVGGSFGFNGLHFSGKYRCEIDKLRKLEQDVYVRRDTYEGAPSI